MDVKKIVEQFGGLSSMTKAMGYKYPSVIQGWIQRNSIPEWRVDAVLTKASELGIILPKTINDLNCMRVNEHD